MLDNMLDDNNSLEILDKIENKIDDKINDYK
jgi:hypothetical protein